MTTTAAAPLADQRVINPATGMAAVTLRVGDLESMSAYYTDAFALQALEERSRGTEVHTPGLPAVDPTQAGLFHTAFLFDDQASLAATVLAAAQASGSRFVGSSDHSVSEAFYFTDPEGNGVELYRDRPRADWVRERGQILMGTTWLDPNDYLRSHLTQTAVDAGPSLAGKVGHVHLQVGNVAIAERFYADALGFEVTLNLSPSALFASAGGYHHHIAMNVWNSRGAGPRGASLGLGDVAIEVPGRDDLDALTARLRAAALPFADDGRAVVVHDPWGTQVTVSMVGTSVDEMLQR